MLWPGSRSCIKFRGGYVSDEKGNTGHSSGLQRSSSCYLFLTPLMSHSPPAPHESFPSDPPVIEAGHLHDGEEGALHTSNDAQPLQGPQVALGCVLQSSGQLK